MKHPVGRSTSSLEAVCRNVVLNVCYFSVALQVSAQAQTPPQPPEAPSIPVTAEVLFGTDRLDLKLVVLKPFAPRSRANFLSVTVAQGEQNNSTTGFDFVNVTNAGYELYKGLGVNVGLTIDRSVGLNTTLGLQYALQKGPLTFLWDPSLFPYGTHDVQNYLQADFRPTIAKRWRLYENLQIFDDYNPTSSVEERRFIHMRSGAQYKRFGFGFGGDLDWYGEPRNFRTNYGPVLAYNF